MSAAPFAGKSLGGVDAGALVRLPRAVAFHLLAVNVYLDASINDVLFTGKLVKSLFIDASPRLKGVFSKSSGSAPKLVHISPLYQEVGGKVRCLYSYAVDREDGQSESRRSRTEFTRVVIRSGVYRFFVGFVEGDVHGALSFDDVYSALLNISGLHRFGSYDVRAELQSVSILDIGLHVRRVVSELVNGGGKTRIIFSSPTLLRDPIRTSKYKSLVPAPLNIFSTPAYILHYLAGKLTFKGVLKTLLILHRLLNEPHSYLDTVKKRWVVYEKGKNPIPALIGYINLHLNKPYYEQYSRSHNVDELLENTLTTIATLGTGTSRATGFGHVTISTETRKD